ncbi:MAG: hypothetical protein QM723_32165 [Myxococcaceae bacterium]
MGEIRLIAIAAALLCACTDPPAAKDLSDPKPLDSKPRGAPEPQRHGWAPWNKTPDPAPAQLAGTFELSSDSSNPASMYTGTRSVRGDANGAKVLVVEVCEHCGEDPVYLRGDLGPEKAKAIIASLEKLRFWALNDGVEVDARDATSTTLHVRVGSVSHDVQLRFGCACDNHRPGDTAGTCACPQSELSALLNQAQKDAAPVDLPQVEEAAFTAPAPTRTIKATGRCSGSRRHGYTCSAKVAERALDPKSRSQSSTSLELEWCESKTPTTFACFESPFATTGFLLQVDKPAEDKATSVKPSPRALLLGSGEHCLREPYAEWKCDQQTPVAAVLRSAKTWVALDHGNKELPLSKVYLR